MTDNKQTYYVIWRGDEDEFMITALELDPLMMAPGTSRLNNNDLIAMCWDAEYGDMDDQIENPFVGGDPASYDLIDVVTGADVQFVGTT